MVLCLTSACGENSRPEASVAVESSPIPKPTEINVPIYTGLLGEDTIGKYIQIGKDSNLLSYAASDAEAWALSQPLLVLDIESGESLRLMGVDNNVYSSIDPSWFGLVPNKELPDG